MTPVDTNIETKFSVKHQLTQCSENESEKDCEDDEQGVPVMIISDCTDSQKEEDH